MAENNQEDRPSFGTPPPTEVSLRTMNSDIKSIEKGEATPLPESVLPPEIESEPVFRPETQATESFKIEEEKPRSKKIWLWIILLIVVLGLGALGYFVVYPLVIGQNQTAEPPPPAPNPIVSPIPHNSFFLTPAPERSQIRLNNLLTLTITNAFQGLSANSGLNPGMVQEVEILDDQGSQIPASSYLVAFLPALSGSEVANWLEDDFTAFLYYDSSGVWPGYVFKVKNAVNLDEARINFNVIESADLTKFYLAPPGSFGIFKDGQINGKITRYAASSQPGAALNYGFVNGYLIISTSYDGLKTAAPLLGI